MVGHTTTAGSRSVRAIVVVALLLAIGACGRPPEKVEPLVVVVASAPAERLERRPIPPSGTHVIGMGETLSEIAYVYRLNTLALARANDISDVHAIRAGDELLLAWAKRTSPAMPPRRARSAREGGPGGVPGGQPLRVVVTPSQIAPTVVANETRRNPGVVD